MKRDMELIRQVLLQVEDRSTGPVRPIGRLEIEGYTYDQITHHVWLLADAGFLNAKDFSHLNGIDWRPIALTWKGAELLDDIRDQEVWSKTKAGIQKVGGAGVELMWELAKAYGKAKLSETLGLQL
jgi:hypothetical protein